MSLIWTPPPRKIWTPSRHQQRGFFALPGGMGAARPSGGGGGGADPNFSYRKLLLRMIGTNGSTTITDESGTPKTITANNGAALSTAQSYFGSGSSLLLDGVNDYIDTADNADFTLGTSDFLIEFMFYMTSAGAVRKIIFGQVNSAGATASVSVFGEVDAANKLHAYCVSGSTTIGECTSTTTISANTWYYGAYGRSGSTFGIYVNSGSPEATATSSAAVNDSSARFAIGRIGEYNALYFPGYIGGFRLTVGLFETPTPPAALWPNS